MSFWVFRCRKCGKHGTKEIRINKNPIFKCTYCNKSTKIKNTKAVLQIQNYGPFEHPNTAVIKCQELNR